MPERRSRLSSFRPFNLLGTGHDDSVRIAQEEIGAHPAELFQREEAQLVHPVVNQRAPVGLGRKHGDEADEIARESSATILS